MSLIIGTLYVSMIFLIMGKSIVFQLGQFTTVPLWVKLTGCLFGGAEAWDGLALAEKQTHCGPLCTLHLIMWKNLRWVVISEWHLSVENGWSGERTKKDNLDWETQTGET